MPVLHLDSEGQDWYLRSFCVEWNTDPEWPPTLSIYATTWSYNVPIDHLNTHTMRGNVYLKWWCLWSHWKDYFVQFPLFQPQPLWSPFAGYCDSLLEIFVACSPRVRPRTPPASTRQRAPCCHHVGQETQITLTGPNYRWVPTRTPRLYTAAVIDLF